MELWFLALLALLPAVEKSVAGLSISTDECSPTSATSSSSDSSFPSSSSSDSSSTSDTSAETPSCEYNGTIYQVGDSFKKSPCVHCECTEYGRILCAVQDCPRPDCDDPVHQEGECCAVCGCLWNGNFYEVGESFQESRCEYCTCEAPNDIVCISEDCADPDCDDPVRASDDCCYVCGCLWNDTLYEYGENYDPDPCTHCTCTADGPVCAVAGCPHPGCQNPVHHPDQCCAVCPVCEFLGTEYQVGESFPAGDDCNTCYCEEDGSVSCTAADCNVCEYLGATYQVGESFPAGDGCNTCFCCENEVVKCTLIYCIFCEHNGTLYDVGDSVPSGDCNVCFCSETGQVVCTRKGCPCEYEGVLYSPGESFPAADGCNTCFCTGSGDVACTKKCCA